MNYELSKYKHAAGELISQIVNWNADFFHINNVYSLNQSMIKVAENCLNKVILISKSSIGEHCNSLLVLPLLDGSLVKIMFDQNAK